MDDDSAHTDLQIRPSEHQLQKLEPHERTIERIAGAYFSACRRAAEWITRLKERADEREEQR